MVARSAIALACALLVGSCATEGVKPHPLPAGVSFAGTWDSTWGRMILRQSGNRVTGTFAGYREGSVTGEADGDVFRFVWDQMTPRSHGHGYMQMSPDGAHLEGRWGYLKEDADGGRWAADRDLTGG